MDRLAEHYELCGASLRENDRDRWLACLFAPDAARPHLFALYAFSAEASRIREHVSQPILGEMRLQWWIDALSAPEGATRGDDLRERSADAGATAINIRANPIADALLATVQSASLPREKLVDLLEARRFDLYEDPAPDMAFFERYCDETCSTLFALASRILGGAEARRDDAALAARHGGRAYAIAGLLRALPWHIARRQCFLPGDLLGRHGLSAGNLFARDRSGAVAAALAELRALARDYLAKSKQIILSLPQPEREAFRLLALSRFYLREMERPDYDPYETLVDIAPWRRQWALWRNRL